LRRTAIQSNGIGEIDLAPQMKSPGTARRFPLPRTVEEYRGISYIVRDANDFPVAYVYFESERGRRAARRSTGVEPSAIANLMNQG